VRTRTLIAIRIPFDQRLVEARFGTRIPGGVDMCSVASFDPGSRA
jgi:hypothetical protein